MDTSASVSSLLVKKRLLVILPIGSIEQHGPLLPIDTDLKIASLLAEKLEKLCLSTNIENLLLPAIPFSCSWEHRGLGTIALNIDTMSSILHNIAKSLKTWNMPILLLLVNWHGGNDLLATLATEISATEQVPTSVIPSTGQVGKAWDESEITHFNDVHAGAVEASVIQAYWPGLVPSSFSETLHYEPEIAPAKVQSVLQALGSRAITKDGTWGAPEQADSGKGSKLIETLAQAIYDQAVRLLALVNEHTK